jgi:G3E family GTPase
MQLIPSTILTGFLGAGKTTLLNRILQENHHHKIAVIENEFGQENIDGEILVQGGAERIVEMSNGCICCTIRGDLVDALKSLATMRTSAELSFDRIVIETTGLADPGPVAQTFFMDDDVAKHYMLDAVVTVVDAVHGMQQLDLHEEARRQAGFADKLLLSKSDLVSADQLALLKHRLTLINPRAPIVTSDFGRLPVSEVLDLRGFNLNDRLDIAPDFSSIHACSTESGACACNACGHHHKSHTSDIAAFSFTSDRPFDSSKLQEFLETMIEAYGQQMLRYKGVLYIQNAPCKVVFQGIHQLMGSDIGPEWRDKETRHSKMVFIGKNLPNNVFIQGLEQCLV